VPYENHFWFSFLADAVAHIVLPASCLGLAFVRCEHSSAVFLGILKAAFVSVFVGVNILALAV